MQGPDARRTEHDVLVAWQHVTDALRNSNSIEDRELAREVADFMRNMPAIARAANRFRQRRMELDRKSETLATRPVEKELNIKPREPMRDR